MIIILLTVGILLAGFNAEAIEANEPIPIEEARKLSEGEQVTVTGWLTVNADKFRGPLYLQDETAGITAWETPARMLKEYTTDRFDEKLVYPHSDVDFEDAQIGDSVVVSGEIVDSYGLKQIAGGENGFEIEVFPEGNREIAPAVITAQELNEGKHESELVMVEDATIDAKAFLQASFGYDLIDPTATTELRISFWATHLDGSPSPPNGSDVTGVASVSNEERRLLPRNHTDLGVEPFSYEAEDYPRENTLDLYSWNIEWFGHPDYGPPWPSDQKRKVEAIIDDMQADVIALQEMYDNELFSEMMEGIDGYAGFLSEGYKDDLDLGFIYNTETVDSVSARVLDKEHGMNVYDHAGEDGVGRLPYEFTFRFKLQGREREITAINIHAKAFGGEEAHNRRKNASKQLYDYIKEYKSEERVILLGDYNARIQDKFYADFGGSPYANFNNSDQFDVLTKNLEINDFFSFGFPPDRNMIDHMTVSRNLSRFFIEGTERVVTPRVVDRYLRAASDHYPIYARFDARGEIVATEPSPTDNRPEEVELLQNYPNPFNANTRIRYALDEKTEVTLTVYDILGRKVKILDEGTREPGRYEVTFNGQRLASGTYMYRLNAGGTVITRTMQLLK